MLQQNVQELVHKRTVLRTENIHIEEQNTYVVPKNALAIYKEMVVTDKGDIWIFRRETPGPGRANMLP